MRLIDADALPRGFHRPHDIIYVKDIDAAPTVSCAECKYKKVSALYGPHCNLRHTDDTDDFGCSDFERGE